MGTRESSPVHSGPVTGDKCCLKSTSPEGIRRQKKVENAEENAELMHTIEPSSSLAFLSHLRAINGFSHKISSIEP